MVIQFFDVTGSDGFLGEALDSHIKHRKDQATRLVKKGRASLVDAASSTLRTEESMQ